MFATGKAIWTIDIKFTAFWNLECLKRESIFQVFFYFQRIFYFCLRKWKEKKIEELSSKKFVYFNLYLWRRAKTRFYIKRFFLLYSILI